MPQPTTTKSPVYAGWASETAFGYAQAVRAGDWIHVSGQAGLGADGELVASADLDEGGRPRDFAAMAPQMRAAYACAAELLAQYGASLSDVVQETLYVLDVPTAFEVGAAVRKAAYATDRPAVASTLIGTPRLALPGQLVEITFVALALERSPSDGQGAEV